jgi:hypothetical protein
MTPGGRTEWRASFRAPSTDVSNLVHMLLTARSSGPRRGPQFEHSATTRGGALSAWASESRAARTPERARPSPAQIATCGISVGAKVRATTGQTAPSPRVSTSHTPSVLPWTPRRAVWRFTDRIQIFSPSKSAHYPLFTSSSAGPLPDNIGEGEPTSCPPTPAPSNPASMAPNPSGPSPSKASARSTTTA